ncbi:FAD:protein FMN transferase [Geothrix fuzhouensis]|uniref:FAD:protein FMN transferase n=1 Tax=Geothrix fuzhouensis TaxID=2966451 RepID=UPI002148A426|nr:FAD:protein FMN transferase [Geothrix fuzhouensis]
MFVNLLPLLLVPALAAGQAAAPTRDGIAKGQPALDRQVLAMGTELRLHLEGPGDLGRASEAALAEAARIEGACSTWDPASAWSRLNAAQGRPVALDREWLDLLAQMKTWQARTDGAFDPVLMSLMQAWAIRAGGRTPTPEALAAARRASGASLLSLDRTTGTASLTRPDAGVEEGGFLKGYALNRMRQAAATPVGLLDFGGQLLAWGAPVDASVADARDRQQPRLSFLLHNASLSSSGTSERGRHILDPRTGEPCPAWGSTAVVAADALTADVLSTALYVLGPDAGLAWAERQGVAAAFLLNDGTVRMSPVFRALHPTLIPRESR